MSADYWLEDLRGCGPDHPEHHYNVTYNLRAMLQAAGFPQWRALDGAPAVEAGGMLVKVAEELRADPTRFKAMDPPNGYGDPEFERQTVANVGALFDLLDPDWRSYTWSGRRGASGRRAE